MIAAVGLRAITTRPSASFWAILAALLVLFAAPAFAPGGVPRAPYAARYIFPGVLMLLLLLSEVGRGVRLRGGYAYAAACGRGDRVCVLDVFEHLRARVPRPSFGPTEPARPRPSSPSLDLARGTVRPSFLAEDPAGLPPIPLASLRAVRRRLLPSRRCLRLAGLQPRRSSPLCVCPFVKSRTLSSPARWLWTSSRSRRSHAAPRMPPTSSRPTPRSGRWGQGA